MKFIVRHKWDQEVVDHVYSENVYRLPKDIKGWSVIDIGANIGSFSILAAERGARVTTFEPQPENLKVLKQNIKKSGLGINLIEKGVGKEGRALINNFGGSSTIVDEMKLLYTPADFVTLNEIEVVPLDSIIQEDCDFLKVDCEGSEYDVFKYASNETMKRIKRLAIEFHNFDESRHWETITKLTKFLPEYEINEHAESFFSQTNYRFF